MGLFKYSETKENNKTVVKKSERKYHVGRKTAPTITGQQWEVTAVGTEKKKTSMQNMTQLLYIMIMITMLISLLLMGFSWKVEQEQEPWNNQSGQGANLKT